MAYYFGINTGDNEYNAAASATTTSKDVEIVINTNANVPSKQELLVAAMNLMNFIIRQDKNW